MITLKQEWDVELDESYIHSLWRGIIYLEMLKNFVFPSKRKYQHPLLSDGAPQYFVLTLDNVLNIQFPGHWLWRDKPILSKPRSAGLGPSALYETNKENKWTIWCLCVKKSQQQTVCRTWILSKCFQSMKGAYAELHGLLIKALWILKCCFQICSVMCSPCQQMCVSETSIIFTWHIA